jgi:hypothetical protein
MPGWCHDARAMTTFTDTISIRLATPDDAVALARLAALDSAAVPSGSVLLGERDGRLEAALGLDDGAAIADPFVASGDVVALLRLRAGGLRPRRGLHLPSVKLSRRRRAFAA